MFIVCLDLEGVLTPEIWINIANKTGIKELQITTRDEPNYDKLMKRRLQILEENNITLKAIQEVISGMELLEGAKNFIDWLQSVTQVIILTDSFIQYTKPLKKKLGNATILCHYLEVNENNIIINYILRIKEMKKVSGVLDVHGVHLWTLCSNVNVLDAHIHSCETNLKKTCKIVDKLNKKLEKFDIKHTTFQFECDRCPIDKLKKIKH